MLKVCSINLNKPNDLMFHTEVQPTLGEIEISTVAKCDFIISPISHRPDVPRKSSLRG